MTTNNENDYCWECESYNSCDGGMYKEGNLVDCITFKRDDNK